MQFIGQIFKMCQISLGFHVVKRMKVYHVYASCTQSTQRRLVKTLTAKVIYFAAREC